MNDFEKNWNRSLRFLSYRPRSEKEISDYLKKKKVSEPVIKKIISKLKEKRFLNDEEFAKIWIQQRVKIKPRAMRIIKRELLEKGLDKDKIDEILKSEKNEIPSDFQMAFSLAERRLRRYKNLTKQEFFEKMGRYLASKGFNYDIIKEVIGKIG